MCPETPANVSNNLWTSRIWFLMFSKSFPETSNLFPETSNCSWDCCCGPVLCILSKCYDVRSRRKKSEIFWIFFIFFSTTWKSELPGSLGKTIFPLQTVFPKGFRDLEFSSGWKKYEKKSKNLGFFSPAQYIVGLEGNAKKPAIVSKSAFGHWFL